MKSPKRSRLATVFAVALVAAGGVGLATSLPSTGAAASTTKTVCADDLYVRADPAGVIIGTLFRGEHFLVHHYSPSGVWAKGFAYGHVNKHGWVMAEYLC